MALCVATTKEGNPCKSPADRGLNSGYCRMHSPTGFPGQCTAKSRRTGNRCHQYACKDRTTCKYHGGRTPRGVANTLSTNMRHTKSLPARMAVRYKEAMTDADLLSLRSEIALLDSRLAEVLEGLTTGESGELWTNLKDAQQDLDSALTSSARDAGVRAAKYAARIRELLFKGHADWSNWAEVRQIIDDRRKLVDSERSRLKDMQQMLTVENAMSLLGAVVDTVRRNVTDKRALEAIANDIGRLMDERTATAASPRGLIVAEQ